jgi:hypothetical protein
MPRLLGWTSSMTAGSPANGLGSSRRIKTRSPILKRVCILIPSVFDANPGAKLECPLYRIQQPTDLPITILAAVGYS